MFRIYNVPKRSIGKAALTSLRTFASKQKISLLRAARLVSGATRTMSLSAKQRQSWLNFVTLITTMRQECNGKPIPDMIRIVLQKTQYETVAAHNVDAQSKLNKSVTVLIQHAGLFQSNFDKTDNKTNSSITALSQFLTFIRQDPKKSGGDAAPNCVTLSTVHQAKVSPPTNLTHPR